jgi:hypothetical protein
MVVVADKALVVTGLVEELAFVLPMMEKMEVLVVVEEKEVLVDWVVLARVVPLQFIETTQALVLCLPMFY